MNAIINGSIPERPVLIASMKVSHGFIGDTVAVINTNGRKVYNNFGEFLKGEYPECGMFLINEERDDRKRNLFTVYLFKGNVGFIINNVPDNLEDVLRQIKLSIKLNSPHRLVEYQSGWNNDDFIRNRITLKLIFKKT
jgi:hypothetical protein